ncbi:MAG: class I SAM-dependent methyltransferase [Candidatus Onthomonas sp.]
MITLTPRLQAVAQWVPTGCRFADIGTDHAYLPVWLLQQGVVDHAIAADLRQGPLDHARATAARYHLTDAMDFRLSDGLQGLAPLEVDCVAIAGMGGEAIRAILSAAPWTREQTRLILQPQTNVPQLRSWLTENGYQIQADRCIREEERWYTVLLITGGTDLTEWTPGSLLAGTPEQWTPGDDRTNYLRFLIRRTRQQLEGLHRAEHPDQVRADALNRAILELEAFFMHQSKGGMK